MIFHNSYHLRHWLAAILLGLSLTTQTSVLAAKFDSGVFEFQQKLANNGSPQAQYKLATMYENGRGVEKDINAAKTWYKKAAANKYKPAEHRLTYMDVKSKGFGEQHKAWLKDLSSDAQSGDSEALYLMGELYEDGTVVKQDLKQAKRMYKASSTKGNVEAENRMFAVEQKLSQQEAMQREKQAKEKQAQEAAKAKEAADKKRAADKERREKQAKAAQSQAGQKQLQAERERQRIVAERKRLEAERRKLEEAQRKLQKAESEAKAADAKAAAKDSKEEENFESELCTGRAARFRTQCN